MTLTTVHGSRQYTLNQLARYLVLLVLLLFGLSLLVSNFLLVKTREDLSGLEQDHQLLVNEYEFTLGTQQLYLSQLNSLGSLFSDVYFERDVLQQEKLRLDADLTDLESMLDVSGDRSAMTPSERVELMKAAARQRLFLLHSIPNGLPIKGQRMSGRFGPRIHPIRKTRSQHNGVDFAAPPGTPIYATADGVVEFGGYSSETGFGNLVILQHNFGFKSYYAHLNKVEVKPREFVHKGQLIGRSGNTGRSTGPHLHYEVRHLHSPIDPEKFMKWGLDNFDTIFTSVEGVQWESLSALYPLNQTGQQ